MRGIGGYTSGVRGIRSRCEGNKRGNMRCKYGTWLR